MISPCTASEDSESGEPYYLLDRSNWTLSEFFNSATLFGLSIFPLLYDVEVLEDTRLWTQKWLRYPLVVAMILLALFLNAQMYFPQLQYPIFNAGLFTLATFLLPVTYFVSFRRRTRREPINYARELNEAQLPPPLRTSANNPAN